MQDKSLWVSPVGNTDDRIAPSDTLACSLCELLGEKDVWR